MWRCSLSSRGILLSQGEANQTAKAYVIKLPQLSILLSEAKANQTAKAHVKKLPLSARTWPVKRRGKSGVLQRKKRIFTDETKINDQ